MKPKFCHFRMMYKRLQANISRIHGTNQPQTRGLKRNSHCVFNCTTIQQVVWSGRCLPRLMAHSKVLHSNSTNIKQYCFIKYLVLDIHFTCSPHDLRYNVKKWFPVSSTIVVKQCSLPPSPVSVGCDAQEKKQTIQIYKISE